MPVSIVRPLGVFAVSAFCWFSVVLCCVCCLSGFFGFWGLRGSLVFFGFSVFLYGFRGVCVAGVFFEVKIEYGGSDPFDFGF